MKYFDMTFYNEKFPDIQYNAHKTTLRYLLHGKLCVYYMVVGTKMWGEVYIVLDRGGGGGGGGGGIVYHY